jgi:hypothetical protein
MPVMIEYTQDGIGVVLYHKGVVTGEELIDAITSVYKSEKYLKIRYWIGERSECEEFLIDPDHAKKIAELNKVESKRNPGILLALVSPTDIQFGMSRMFQAFSDDSLFKTEVFRDKASAENWISKELKKT